MDYNKIGLISGIFSLFGLITAIPFLAYISSKKLTKYLKRKEARDIFTAQDSQTVHKFTYFYNNIKYLPYIYTSLYEKIYQTLDVTTTEEGDTMIRQAIIANHRDITSVLDNTENSEGFINF